jgi:hypothetical protein
VTSEEIRTTLFAAAKLRIPRFDDADTQGMRIEKLEAYLLLSAQTGGDLEEARLYCQQALFDLTKQWEALVGWEIHVPAGAKARTGPVIREAKRLLDPDLHEAIEESKWLIARLTEQGQRLNRMGHDQIASRVYSLMAGG